MCLLCSSFGVYSYRFSILFRFDSLLFCFTQSLIWRSIRNYQALKRFCFIWLRFYSFFSLSCSNVAVCLYKLCSFALIKNVLCFEFASMDKIDELLDEN